MDDQVGVVVEGEERGDLLRPPGDLAIEQHPALGRDVVGEQQLVVAEAGGEGQLLPERVEDDAAGPLVGGEDVVVTLGVVELARLGLDDGVLVRQLAEIQARLGDRQVHGGHRRQVADEEHRQALAGHLVDRTEGQAVAVGERQPLVDPGAVGQRRRIQLARRQHHLAQLAVDLVAVVVHRGEVVVGADLLDLAEGLEQRLVIPQPDVVEGGAVAVDVGAGQLGIAGQRPLHDAIEREGAPRRLDVVLDVRRLAYLLVRGDDEALQRAGVELAAERDHAVERHGRDRRRLSPGERVDDGQAGADQPCAHLGQRERQPGVDVGVAGTADDPGGRQQHARPIQPGAKREQHEQQGHQQTQVAAGPFAQAHPERRDRHLPAEQVHRAGAGQRQADQRHRQRPRLFDDRQREDVEADVVAEHRIGDAEGLALLPAQHLLPGRGRVERGDDRRAGGEHGAEHFDLAACGHRHRQPLGRGHLLRVQRQGPGGDLDVRHQPGQRQQQRDAAEHRAQRQHGAEDLLVPDLAEPPPVGGEFDGIGQHERQQHRDDQGEGAKGQPHDDPPV